MSNGNKKTGDLGERKAARYLKLKGYSILDRNFRIRNGEIDIIARDLKGTIVFVEVKTRRGDQNGSPADAVDFYKRRHIINTAKTYIARKGLYDKDVRFDVIEVRPEKRLFFTFFGINHIKNAFEV